MRVVAKKKHKVTEIDMTPMIDMTFQLIAFFMVIINFTESEQNQEIQLPASELAKPPDAAVPNIITLQITKPEDGRTYVWYAGRRWPTLSEGLRKKLQNEIDFMGYDGKTAADATIVIRGDMVAKTGDVQRLIEMCQDLKFVNFALRARQEREH